MRRIVNELQKKTIEELEREIRLLREEIAKLQLEFEINLPKDTNILAKKKKQLARMLTILTEKLAVKQLASVRDKSH